MGANAQTSVPTFTAGEILTAANMNISARTGIPVFADATARDAAFGGTGEKTLAEGQFAYLESTNATQYYDGAAWQAVGAASGLTLISSTTIGTAVTSVALTNVFSSTYDNYKIILSGGSASATSDGSFVLGATTSGYYTGFSFQAIGGGGSFTSTGITNGASTATVWAYSSNGINGMVDLYQPFLTSRTSYFFTAQTMATAGNRWQGGGFQDSATSFTGITFSTQSGHTITGGTIKVYGYANS
jgi:hypothetical protein